MPNWALEIGSPRLLTFAGLDFDFCLGILVFLRSRVERRVVSFFLATLIAIIDTDSGEKTHAPVFEGWGGGGEGGGGNVF